MVKRDLRLVQRTTYKRFHPPSFGEEVLDDTLEISRLAFTAVKAVNVRTAAGLVSYLQVFPDYMARVMGWNMQELRTAHAKLLLSLRAHLPRELLMRSRRKAPPMGVIGRGT